MPEVNSKVATMNAERYQTNCCHVGANTSGGDVSQWGVFILHVDNNEMKQETIIRPAPYF